VNDSSRFHGGLFFGILITVVGVIFLLDQMHIIHASYLFEVFWPLILIGWGVSMILRTIEFRGSHMPSTENVSGDLSSARSMTINFWGPVLIVIGVIWLLSNLTHFAVGRLWPLWLIAIGVWLVINKDRPRHLRMHRRDWNRYGHPYGWPPTGAPGPGPAAGSGPGPNPTSAGFANQGTGGQAYGANESGEWGARPQAPPSPPPPGAPGSPAGTSGSGAGPGPSAPFASSGCPPAAESFDDTFDRSVIFMSFNRRITSRRFRFGKVSAVFGGFHLDFTGAEMEGNQAVLQIEAVFGGGEIRIPPTWRVSVTAHEIAGAIVDETYSQLGAAAPTKVLVIHGTTVFGGVVIKN
jgi:LiaI-LiaF-like transmembrane region/LiaF transmembrane domain